MKSKLSPSDVEVLIWCHCRPEPHERITAGAVRDALVMWSRAGMIESALDCLAGTYRTTPKGCAMIEALCAVAVPGETTEPPVSKRTTAFTDRNGDWKTDRPSRVGVTHIWFRDVDGGVCVYPIANVRLEERLDVGAFRCCETEISRDTFSGIVAILDSRRVFPDWYKIAVDKQPGSPL